MKTLKIIALSLLAATAASAADLPRKSAAPAAVMAPVPMAWQGGYVGAFGGLGLTTALSGPLFGVQAGYDMQVNQIVFGVVGDIAIANERGNFAGAAGTVQANRLGSLRGRVGYAVSPSTLIYATAGVGFTGLKSTEYVTPSSASTTATGLTGGVGAEFKFDRNWSVFGEYRATAVGTKTFSTTVPTTISGNNHDLRVGVNYRF